MFTLWIMANSKQRPLFHSPKGGRCTQVWLYLTNQNFCSEILENLAWTYYDVNILKVSNLLDGNAIMKKWSESRSSKQRIIYIV